MVTPNQTSPMSGAGAFMDALRLLHEAARDLGIKSPVAIGFTTSVAVNAVETALAATPGVEIKPIKGGFEVGGIAVRKVWA